MNREQGLLQILLEAFPEDEALVTAICSSYAYVYLYSFRLQHRRHVDVVTS